MNNLKNPEDIAKGFIKITHQIRSRFDKSKEDRDRIAQQIKNKERPSGYRVDWISDTSLDVVDLIKKSCRNFNSDHPDDIATVEDMMDILGAAMSRIKPKR